MCKNNLEANERSKFTSIKANILPLVQTKNDLGLEVLKSNVHDKLVFLERRLVPYDDPDEDQIENFMESANSIT